MPGSTPARPGKATVVRGRGSRAPRAVGARARGEPGEVVGGGHEVRGGRALERRIRHPQGRQHGLVQVGGEGHPRPLGHEVGDHVEAHVGVDAPGAGRRHHRGSVEGEAGRVGQQVADGGALGPAGSSRAMASSSSDPERQRRHRLGDRCDPLAAASRRWRRGRRRGRPPPLRRGDRPPGDQGECRRRSAPSAPDWHPRRRRRGGRRRHWSGGVPHHGVGAGAVGEEVDGSCLSMWPMRPRARSSRRGAAGAAEAGDQRRARPSCWFSCWTDVAGAVVHGHADPALAGAVGATAVPEAAVPDEHAAPAISAATVSNSAPYSGEWSKRCGLAPPGWPRWRQ